MQVIAVFGKRSQFLIEAIENYTRDHQRPPETLEQLVPDYLPAVPDTGMMAYPEYEYHTGKSVRERYQENPWALIEPTGSGGPNWDLIMYFPKQNYLKNGYGGWLEPVGDCDYVHE